MTAALSAHGVLSIAVFAAHAAGAVAAVHAAFTARTPQGAIAWALALVFLPYAALVPYAVLGPHRFHAYRAARRDSDISFSPDTAGRAAAGTPTPSGFQVVERLAAGRATYGNKLDLLIDGDATFSRILETIDAARTFVIVEFFLVRDDDLGRTLRDRLAARARAGVSVFVLTDGVGSHGLPSAFWRPLREAGGDARSFAPRRGLFARRQLNFRNHRKLVVVDGHHGFIGGLNAADEYLGRSARFGRWRDGFVHVRGAAVADLQRAFAEDWYWVTGRHPVGRYPTVSCTIEPAPREPTLILATGPADPADHCILFFVHAINHATSRLWISTPYYVPDPAIATALELAVLRGVDVRLLLPDRPDHRSVFLATTLYAHEAMRAGVKVYRFADGFLHQKAMVTDDLASIGSANLDYRSLRLNFELMLLTGDGTFHRSLVDAFERDFSSSRRIGVDEYESSPRLRRAAMHVARLFAPVL